MKEIKLVTSDYIPCWYELTWRGYFGTVLRIHCDFVKQVKVDLSTIPMVEDFSRHFGLSAFAGEFGRDFGFEACLPYLGEKGDFLEYSIPSPVIVTRYGSTDYHKPYAVSATLTTLLELMSFSRVQSSCPSSQLMLIQTKTAMGFNGSPISGEFSSEVIECMRKRDEGEICEMTETMRSVWGLMNDGIKTYDERLFRAFLYNKSGWLYINCPGDRCEMVPAHERVYESDTAAGYKFSSHNVDTPMQQLTILASLAALHDLVRKDRGN